MHNRRRNLWIMSLVALLVVLSSAVSVPVPSVTCTPTTLSASSGTTLWFSGYEWEVRSGSGEPGPNSWDESNAWVDGYGYLHLKINKKGDTWYCAEVSTVGSLGFGQYEFQVIGQIDQLDPNVVLGLFNYPSADVEPSDTNEIDIEFSKWGEADTRNGSYTVWPATTGLKQAEKSFSFTLNRTITTHEFLWGSRQVMFESFERDVNDQESQLASWVYRPDAYLDRIPQQSLPVYMNLWLFNNEAPSDGKEVEAVIRSFTFTPDGNRETKGWVCRCHA